ncbi:hypothetical protein E4U17_000374 [Claviceps sp. LM77 group G4]|nr:hypothetical protein E4U17_000374 [Claviceps sp. LM77 group G4]KAG6052453.1 hypothetical protein E4U33_000531 [Claviceps sp. LM78 group G4]KAG6071242.1 hypothetical protein E4U16_006282 [Claviceps sp. LM84 group G4]
MRTLRTTVAAITRHTNHLPPSTGSLRIIAAKASSPRRFYSQKLQQTPASSSPHVQEQQQPQISPSPSPQVEQQQQHPQEQKQAQTQTQTQRNYYHLFPQTLPDGPPPQSPFKINLRALRREYLALQAQCHPDKQDPQDQPPTSDTPQNLSSLINEAYRTLKDPLLRAEHILAINGLPTADDQNTLDDVPQEARTELFTTVWQEHEKLGRAEKAEDLDVLRDDTRRRIEASEATMGHAFEEQDLQKARWEVVRLRYWVRIQDAVREWPEGLAKEMREWGE